MCFTDQLWNEGEPLLKKMIEHPFNRELASGTLPRVAFNHYLQQDELYIKDYTKTLLHLAERTDNEKLKRDLLRFAEDGYLLEKEMHDMFFDRYVVSPAREKSFTCEAYSGFLSDCSQKSSLPVALAALLPCFWFYWKVGLSLLDNCSADNQYQTWIDLYSGEAFQEQVQCLLTHVDDHAEHTDKQERKDMQDAFITSSLLELAFWESVYQFPSQESNSFFQEELQPQAC